MRLGDSVASPIVAEVTVEFNPLVITPSEAVKAMDKATLILAEAVKNDLNNGGKHDN